MFRECCHLLRFGGFEVGNPELTKDQRKLLFLIHTYAHEKSDDEQREYWFKDGPLLAAMYELTVGGVFETYDYAAMSILCLDGYRRFMNITREGVDDLNDLRELGLLEHLKISTTQYGTVTGYRLSNEGRKILATMPQDEQESVRKYIQCTECEGTLLQIECENFEQYYFHCPKCDSKREIGVFDIEDVSYVSKAKFLRLPYRNDHYNTKEGE